MRVYTSWYTWVGAALLALGIVLRAVSYPVISSDQQYFVAKWFTALMGGGLSAFANPFADYAPLYLYLIKLLTFIPMTSLYSTCVRVFATAKNNTQHQTGRVVRVGVCRTGVCANRAH
jgi:Gpi18-like mannosyltransferase